MNFETYRVKRDINVPAPSPSVTTTAPVGVTSANEKDGKNETTTSTNSTQPLLGENGAGQRKYYPPPSTNDTKPVAAQSTPSVSLSSSPPLLTTANNNTSTINKSLNAVPPTKVVETEAFLPEEKDIGDIDEPEEEIKKEDEAHGKTQKIDYFQYYNSTTSFNADISNEYWSQKKEYIMSSILSKSHRRAIVSILRKASASNICNQCYFHFTQCLIDR